VPGFDEPVAFPAARCRAISELRLYFSSFVYTHDDKYDWLVGWSIDRLIDIYIFSRIQSIVS